jgi:hypothetical protein
VGKSDSRTTATSSSSASAHTFRLVRRLPSLRRRSGTCRASTSPCVGRAASLQRCPPAARAPDRALPRRVPAAVDRRRWWACGAPRCLDGIDPACLRPVMQSLLRQWALSQSQTCETKKKPGGQRRRAALLGRNELGGRSRGVAPGRWLATDDSLPASPGLANLPGRDRRRLAVAAGGCRCEQVRRTTVVLGSAREPSSEGRQRPTVLKALRAWSSPMTGRHAPACSRRSSLA